MARLSREYKSRVVKIAQEQHLKELKNQLNAQPVPGQPQQTPAPQPRLGPPPQPVPQRPVPVYPPWHPKYVKPETQPQQFTSGNQGQIPVPPDTTYMKTYEENRVDYDNIRSQCHVSLCVNDEVDVSVIIPVRSRTHFNRPLMSHLRKAMVAMPGKTYSITIVEYDYNREHEALCAEQGVNYINIPLTNMFNKCLAFNVGVLFGTRAKYYVFHDLDIMVTTNFFTGIFANLQRVNNTALQTFTQKRVLYCDANLSNQILYGGVQVDNLNNKSGGISEPDREQRKAPGGSIFCSRDQFFDVGGFDAELFQGYSIEDQFFHDKLTLTCGINSCDSPMVEVFHLYHEPLWNSNPKADLQHHLYANFKAQPREKKVEFFAMERDNIIRFK